MSYRPAFLRCSTFLIPRIIQVSWLGKESSLGVILNEWNIYLCFVSATWYFKHRQKPCRQINANFSGLDYKRIQYSFFLFSAKNKSQYWYGNEQKLQSIPSKKFVLSDPNLSIANHCPLFWQFTKLFFKNWSKQLNVVNNIKFQIHFEN